ncbi:uncharacterized protein BXZ73DRAFT_78021 [Epithele typhae]|uniref:uncharacterized protein n=1 Tax=Epithele typhae TaxID=378194 RepID=UPI002007D68D|nr:uncharacterized protein BXZ73DRAFT_78021 [Epithele typhae]KAH9929914.1 hypothetical protein BXZ73DRAFT_78021 [Epithele typhae]
MSIGPVGLYDPVPDIINLARCSSHCWIFKRGSVEFLPLLFLRFFYKPVVAVFIVIFIISISFSVIFIANDPAHLPIFKPNVLHYFLISISTTLISFICDVSYKAAHHNTFALHYHRRDKQHRFEFSCGGNALEHQHVFHWIWHWIVVGRLPDGLPELKKKVVAGASKSSRVEAGASSMVVQLKTLWPAAPIEPRMYITGVRRRGCSHFLNGRFTAFNEGCCQSSWWRSQDFVSAGMRDAKSAMHRSATNIRDTLSPKALSLQWGQEYSCTGSVRKLKGGRGRFENRIFLKWSELERGTTTQGQLTEDAAIMLERLRLNKTSKKGSRLNDAQEAEIERGLEDSHEQWAGSSWERRTVKYTRDKDECGSRWGGRQGRGLEEGARRGKRRLVPRRWAPKWAAAGRAWAAAALPAPVFPPPCPGQPMTPVARPPGLQNVPGSSPSPARGRPPRPRSFSRTRTSTSPPRAPIAISPRAPHIDAPAFQARRDAHGHTAAQSTHDRGRHGTHSIHTFILGIDLGHFSCHGFDCTLLSTYSPFHSPAPSARAVCSPRLTSSSPSSSPSTSTSTSPTLTPTFTPTLSPTTSIPFAFASAARRAHKHRPHWHFEMCTLEECELRGRIIPPQSTCFITSLNIQCAPKALPLPDPPIIQDVTPSPATEWHRAAVSVLTTIVLSTTQHAACFVGLAAAYNDGLFSGLQCLQYPPHFPFCMSSKGSQRGPGHVYHSLPQQRQHQLPSSPLHTYQHIISSPSTSELSHNCLSLGRCGGGSDSPGRAPPPCSLAAIPHSHRYNLLKAAAIIFASARISIQSSPPPRLLPTTQGTKPSPAPLKPPPEAMSAAMSTAVAEDKWPPLIINAVHVETPGAWRTKQQRARLLCENKHPASQGPPLLPAPTTPDLIKTGRPSWRSQARASRPEPGAPAGTRACDLASRVVQVRIRVGAGNVGQNHIAHPFSSGAALTPRSPAGVERLPSVARPAAALLTTASPCHQRRRAVHEDSTSTGPAWAVRALKKRGGQTKRRASLGWHLHNRWADHYQPSKLQNAKTGKMEEMQIALELVWIRVRFMENAFGATFKRRMGLTWACAIAWHLMLRNKKLLEDGQRLLTQILNGSLRAVGELPEFIDARVDPGSTISLRSVIAQMSGCLNCLDEKFQAFQTSVRHSGNEGSSAQYTGCVSRARTRLALWTSHMTGSTSTACAECESGGTARSRGRDPTNTDRKRVVLAQGRRPPAVEATPPVLFNGAEGHEDSASTLTLYSASTLRLYRPTRPQARHLQRPRSRSARAHWMGRPSPLWVSMRWTKLTFTASVGVAPEGSNPKAVAGYPTGQADEGRGGCVKEEDGEQLYLDGVEAEVAPAVGRKGLRRSEEDGPNRQAASALESSATEAEPCATGTEIGGRIAEVEFQHLHGSTESSSRAITRAGAVQRKQGHQNDSLYQKFSLVVRWGAARTHLLPQQLTEASSLSLDICLDSSEEDMRA